VIFYNPETFVCLITPDRFSVLLSCQGLPFLGLLFQRSEIHSFSSHSWLAAVVAVPLGYYYYDVGATMAAAYLQSKGSSS
jgi:hypothetical protein